MYTYIVLYNSICNSMITKEKKSFFIVQYFLLDYISQYDVLASLRVYELYLMSKLNISNIGHDIVLYKRNIYFYFVILIIYNID